jgi:NADP-dependent 3-hydroxy acid dehydrogenase YdfG
MTAVPQLGGRAALVTGASRGIGLEVARVLAAEGMRVAMLARSQDLLRAAAGTIGERALAVPCDVGDTAAVERAANAVRGAFAGPPDVIVNCAGVFQLAPVEQTTIDAFRSALDVNVLAPFLVVRAFLADMRARSSGHIVTIGSIADRVVFPENAAYAASKFGARALHETLRMELRGSGLRASLISPGPVDTALWDAIDPDTRPGFTPRHEMLPATAVAAAVRYVVMQPAAVNIDELRLSHS